MVSALRSRSGFRGFLVSGFPTFCGFRLFRFLGRPEYVGRFLAAVESHGNAMKSSGLQRVCLDEAAVVG